MQAKIIKRTETTLKKLRGKLCKAVINNSPEKEKIDLIIGLSEDFGYSKSQQKEIANLAIEQLQSPQYAEYTVEQFVTEFMQDIMQ